jgi:hypothetical protein
VNHEQRHGSKERRKKEAGQDTGRKAGCEERKEASQGLNAGGGANPTVTGSAGRIEQRVIVPRRLLRQDVDSRAALLI